MNSRISTGASEGLTAPEAVSPQPEGMEGPSFTTREIIRFFVLCGCLGFGAMSAAHVKFTQDMAANWEQINE